MPLKAAGASSVTAIIDTSGCAWSAPLMRIWAPLSRERVVLPASANHESTTVSAVSGLSPSNGVPDHLRLCNGTSAVSKQAFDLTEIRIQRPRYTSLGIAVATTPDRDGTPVGVQSWNSSKKQRNIHTPQFVRGSTQRGAAQSLVCECLG